MNDRRASVAEREHFARIGRIGGPAQDERAPSSIGEALERLEKMRRALGALSEAGLPGDDRAEFESHRRLATRFRELHARTQFD